MNISTVNLWKNYTMATNLILDAIGGASNIVGEFAEQLVADYYGGKQLTASSKSADIVLENEKTIQVKARMPRQTMTTSLGIIRSWNFDYLVVVLFSPDGSVLKAIEMNVDDARSIAVTNKHQNGWVITTTQGFLNHKAAREITDGLNGVLNGVLTTNNVILQQPIAHSETTETPSRIIPFARVATTRSRNTNDALHGFQVWMRAEGYPESTISNRSSNIRKVERYEGELIMHYNNDKCKSLLERMAYIPNQPQHHCIPIKGNVKNGMSTLRSAVKLYVSFRNSSETQ
jgi:hypothetical protein